MIDPNVVVSKDEKKLKPRPEPPQDGIARGKRPKGLSKRKANQLQGVYNGP